MGMESYSITVLAKGVKIEYEDGYQKIIGSSVLDVSDVKKKISSIGMQCVQDNEYTYDDCLEVYIYQLNGKFQGLEIKGCLSWIEEGVKECFKIISHCREWYNELEIYIMDKKIECENAKQLGNYLDDAYEKKINLFNKQYNNIVLKATCGKFYQQMLKQNRWYYKLFHRFWAKL